MKSLEELYSTLWKLLVVAAGVYFAFDLFIRRTPVEVGRETTYLVEPLAEDGLPNYTLAIHQKQREGVTPENNAAALMWQAVRPPQIADEEYALICRDLGATPSTKEQFLAELFAKETKKRLMEWRLAAEGDAAKRELNDVEEAEFAETTADWIEEFYRIPWKREHAPPLADWLEENQAPLDLLAAAAARPKLYIPSPNFLTDPDTTVLDMGLAHAEIMRSSARALSIRATSRLGSGQFEEAWKDCLTCWRFSEHAGKSETLIDRLVGIALRLKAMRLTVALLQSPDLPTALARQVRENLEGFQERIDLTPTLDYSERLMFLDAALRVTKHRPVQGWEEDEIYNLPITVDANVVLQVGNSWYDRIVKAASTPDRAKRKVELAALNDEFLKELEDGKDQLFFAAFNRTTRSRIFANLLLLTMMPSLEAITRSEDHDATNYQLAKLAICLKIYQADHGEYPKTLESLVPYVMPAVPLDPYSGEPFIYKRCEEGYLLYSVSANGADDGGDDAGEPIVDGEWLSPEAWSEFSPPDFLDADIVVRVPLPPPQPLKLPASRESEPASAN